MGSRSLLLYFFSLLLLVSCQQKHDPRHDQKLTIAVSANMHFVMQELSQAFTKQTGIYCDLITGSSGKLTSQIKEGAPYDIFVSADMTYPTILFDTGFTHKKPKVYAYGTLVLWSFIDSTHPSLTLLENPKIQHIAMANPKVAPYGIATQEVLKKHLLYSKIKDKLVFGESISQTNQFIVSQSAQIGFTAKSVVLSPQMKGKGNWIELDKMDYAPIAQGIVMLKHQKERLKNAEKFYNFITTERAHKILTDFGYLIKKNT